MKKFLVIVSLMVSMFSLTSIASAGSWNWANSSGFQVSNSIIVEDNNQTIVDSQCYDIDCVNGSCVVQECDPDDYDVEFEVSPGFLWMSVHMFGKNK